MKLSQVYVVPLFFAQAYSTLRTPPKICKDCRHFIGDSFGCGKFGDTNIINGKVTYSSAKSVREDVTKCGQDAVFFETNDYKFITVPYYFLKENWIPTGIFGMYFFIVSQILQR